LPGSRASGPGPATTSQPGSSWPSLVTAAALRPLHGRRVAASAVAIALTVATAYSAIAAFEHGAVGARVLATGPSVASFLAQVPRERDLASFAWGVAVRANAARYPLTVGFALAKALTWTGLLAMVVFTTRLALGAQALSGTQPANRS